MTLQIEQIPIIGELPNLTDLLDSADTVTVTAGDTLFEEGQPTQYLYVRLSGRCMVSRHARPLGEARSDEILDLIAVLGGLPHAQRAVAITDCEFLRWEIDDLWRDARFSAGARRYLADNLQQASTRLDQLQAPVHYQPYTAQVYSGPFVFPNSAIVFVFCKAQPEHLTLPAGVSRIGGGLLLGIAEFPAAGYHHHPEARFAYTETTIFVPVRVGARLGLFAPYIYPSTYEPIVLGREIYGFPKQLGQTTISDSRASLTVAGEEYLSLHWGRRSAANEPRIVGAFGQLFGVTGRVTAAAFALGDTLLTMMNVPFYRRVSVFNHKRIPATEMTHSDPAYDVDQLTQAIFSVEHWQSIDHLPDVRLIVTGGIFKDWDVALRDAFYTRLSMRLSTGRVVRDYRVS